MDSSEFSRILSMRFVFSGILSDFIVVSPILLEFGQILAYSFEIWLDSRIFARILPDSAGFSRFFSDSERFFQILSHSLGLLWFLPNLSDYLDFFRFFPDTFSYPVGILLDSLVFFWILSDLDFFTLSCILSKSLLILWILLDSLESSLNSPRC